MNGAASERSLSERHSSQAINAVTIGTGERSAMFGHENQRLAILACRNGVHRLTAATPMRTPMKAMRPSRRAQSCSVPSVLRMSHPAPSSIAKDEGDACQQRKWREALER